MWHLLDWMNGFTGYIFLGFRSWECYSRNDFLEDSNRLSRSELLERDGG